MKKVAVMLAPGYEEGEALMVVDIIRRGGFEVDALGLLGEQVTGGHGVTVLADKVFDGSLEGYDMVVLPGGYDGAATMRDHERARGTSFPSRRLPPPATWGRAPSRALPRRPASRALRSCVRR